MRDIRFTYLRTKLRIFTNVGLHFTCVLRSRIKHGDNYVRDIEPWIQMFFNFQNVLPFSLFEDQLLLAEVAQF